MTQYYSTTAIAKFGGGNVWYLDGDNNFPYTMNGNLFYYYTRTEQGFVLSMTSLRDLQDMKQ